MKFMHSVKKTTLCKKSIKCELYEDIISNLFNEKPRKAVQNRTFITNKYKIASNDIKPLYLYTYLYNGFI